MTTKDIHVYNAYNFTYDFSQGKAYLTNGGLSPIDDDVYEYTSHSTVLSSSITLYSEDILPVPGDIKIDICCYDELGEVIPGKSEMVPNGLAMQVSYKFQKPLPPKSKVRFELKSSSFPTKQTHFIFCNATVKTTI